MGWLTAPQPTFQAWPHMLATGNNLLNWSAPPSIGQPGLPYQPAYGGGSTGSPGSVPPQQPAFVPSPLYYMPPDDSYTPPDGSQIPQQYGPPAPDNSQLPPTGGNGINTYGQLQTQASTNVQGQLLPPGTIVPYSIGDLDQMLAPGFEGGMGGYDLGGDFEGGGMGGSDLGGDV